MHDHEMHCAICQAELIHDTAPLDDLDDHGVHPGLDDPGYLDDPLDDEPERLCTGCGSGIVSAPLTGRVWWRPRGFKIAPHQRRRAA